MRVNMKPQTFFIIFLCLCCNCFCEKRRDTSVVDYITSSSEYSPESKKEMINNWMENTNKKLEKLENNLQNVIPSIKDNMDLQFFKMIEKMEEYLNTKLKLLKTELLENMDEHKNIKMNALEQKLPGAVKNISYQLSILEKNIEENNVKKCNVSEKYTPKSNEDIIKRIQLMENKILDNLEGNINIKFEAFVNKMPGLQANLTSSLNSLGMKIPENFENYLDKKLNVVQKELIHLDEKITPKLDVLQKMLPDITENCTSLTNNDLKSNIEKKFNSLKILDEEILKQINDSKNKSCGHNEMYFCETVAVQGYNYQQFYRIDDGTFKYSTLNKDSEGITFFEMDIAVMAAKDGIIMLSAKEHPGPRDSVFEIVLGVGDNNHTDLRRKKILDSVAHVDTPQILSVTHHTAFFIKIANGQLEVGYKGKAPFLTHKDAELKHVKYISFASWDNKVAHFIFGCPKFL